MATTLANISIKDSSRWSTFLNLIYPVGSIYFSYTSTSPASRFGGAWSQITSKFLYAGTSVDTGGANITSLTWENIPSHTHQLQEKTGWYYGETGGNSNTYRRIALVNTPISSDQHWIGITNEGGRNYSSRDYSSYW